MAQPATTLKPFSGKKASDELAMTYDLNNPQITDQEFESFIVENARRGGFVGNRLLVPVINGRFAEVSRQTTSGSMLPVLRAFFRRTLEQMGVVVPQEANITNLYHLIRRSGFDFDLDDDQLIRFQAGEDLSNVLPEPTTTESGSGSEGETFGAPQGATTPTPSEIAERERSMDPNASETLGRSIADSIEDALEQEEEKQEGLSGQEIEAQNREQGLLIHNVDTEATQEEQTANPTAVATGQPPEGLVSETIQEDQASFQTATDATSPPPGSPSQTTQQGPGSTPLTATMGGPPPGPPGLTETDQESFATAEQGSSSTPRPPPPPPPGQAPIEPGSDIANLDDFLDFSEPPTSVGPDAEEQGGTDENAGDTRDQRARRSYPRPIHADALGLFFYDAHNPQWDDQLFLDRRKRFAGITSVPSGPFYNQSRMLVDKFGPEILVSSLKFGQDSGLSSIIKENHEILQLYMALKRPQVGTRKIMKDPNNVDQTVGVPLSTLANFRAMIAGQPGVDPRPAVQQDVPRQGEQADSPFDLRVEVTEPESITKLRGNGVRIEDRQNWKSEPVYYDKGLIDSIRSNRTRAEGTIDKRDLEKSTETDQVNTLPTYHAGPINLATKEELDCVGFGGFRI